MPINRLTMLFESEMLSDTADAMRDVKSKEGVNSKQPALVRGRVIRGDAIAAIWFSYFLMFYWLELRTYRDSACTAKRSSRVCRKIRKHWRLHGRLRQRSAMQFHTKLGRMQPPAVKSWSWVDVGWDCVTSECHFLKEIFRRSRSNLVFSIQQT